MFGGKEGSVALLSLIVIFMLIGISGAMFYSSHSYSIMIQQEKTSTKLFYITETGLAHGLSALNGMDLPGFSDALLGPDGLENTADDGMIREDGMILNGLDGSTAFGEGTKLFGDGAYRVRIVNNPEDLGGQFEDTDGILILRSIGFLGNQSKRMEYILQANLVPQSPFSKGPILANKEVEIKKRNFIAAINSSLPKTILEQILDGDWLPGGDINSNGKIKAEENSIIKGSLSTSAEAENGEITLELEVEVSGNVFSNKGDISIHKDVIVGGKIATNNGNVTNSSEGSVSDDAILPEGGASVALNQWNEFVSKYDNLLAEKDGGSISEIPVPTIPSSFGVPLTNIFGAKTYTGGVVTLGAVGTDSKYYFEKLTLLNGAALELKGNVVLIVNNELRLKDVGTKINALDGDITLIVKSYEQNLSTSLNVASGNLIIESQKSIEINGSTKIDKNATFVAKDDLAFKSGSVVDVKGDAIIAAFSDAEFQGNGTIEGNSRIDAGGDLDFKSNWDGVDDELEGKGSYTFNGNVIVDVLDDFNVGDESSVTLNGEENYFFAENSLTFTGFAKLSNHDPSKFFVYAHGDGAGIKFDIEQSVEPLAASIFAPKGKIELIAGNLDTGINKTFIGSFVANEILVAKNNRIVYDTKLDSFGPTVNAFIGYKVIAYKEY